MRLSADILHIQDVSVRRDGNLVLDRVSWRVRRGEHWVLLGRNGSGKTTLLNVVNGYVWPYAGQGTVDVLGRRLGQCDLPALRRSIGWVSSSLHERLYRQHSARRVVLSGKFAAIGLWTPAAGSVTAADRRKAEALLAQLGCGGLADRPYGSLSQGEQQKVLIARALMADPQLLLLDEPCAGLDFVARETVLQAVEAMAVRPDGPTLIHVTHHVEEIVPAFQHVLLLERGKVVAQGRKERVLAGGVLSRAFGLAVSVHWHEGRASVTLDPTAAYEGEGRELGTIG